MLTEIVVGIVVAAASALFGRMKLPRGVPVRTTVLVVGAAALGFGAAVLVSLSLGSDPSLTIYSSLPHRTANGKTNTRTKDMEAAIRRAWHERGERAGTFTIKYRALDSTDESGAFLPRKIEEHAQENARTAARDDDTAVYIGDFSSSASIESIPILSEAGVPQISPSSTRVGLTIDDAFSDDGEPDQYYPGRRNFVRVIPNDYVQAAALGARMKLDRCAKVAIIYDGKDYSQGLAVLMSRIKGPRRFFSEDVRPNEGSDRYEYLAKRAGRNGVDCFLYMGADNPNTFGIFEAFAKELPDDGDTHLYGTDGVSVVSLTDAQGDLARFANRVRLMVPPRDLDARSAFESKFDQTPDPYAVYAYEAMTLAMDAIKESGSGSREDIRKRILERLKSGEERDGPLGTYSIKNSGDTDLVGSNFLTFRGGAPEFNPTVKTREILERRVDLLSKPR